MNEYERAREKFRRAYGFDPAPVISQALSSGDFELEGGTEDDRVILCELLTGNHGPAAYLGPMADDHGFPRVQLPPFEPLPDDTGLAPLPAVLRAERDTAYRVINALVRQGRGRVHDHRPAAVTGRVAPLTRLAEPHRPARMPSGCR